MTIVLLQYTCLTRQFKWSERSHLLPRRLEYSARQGPGTAVLITPLPCSDVSCCICSAGVYRTLLEAKGYHVLEVHEQQQPALHESIYNSEWGIKAVSPVTEQAVVAMRQYAQQLQRAGAHSVRESSLMCDWCIGADVIILGCSEIPLALPEAEYLGVAMMPPMLPWRAAHLLLCMKVPLIDPVEAAARAMIKVATCI